MDTKWVQEAAKLEKSGIDFVMVSVFAIKGSTPREIGARMLVTQHAIYGTVGGGHLEWKAIAKAREKLSEKDSQTSTEDYPLGATLGQCCGGFVTLLFESVLQSPLTIAIFGAGHVGRAIVHCLENIPCHLIWVDSRQDEFPTQVSDKVTTKISDYPVDEVADMPANTFYLVLTHNHQLDLELTEAVIKRNDAAFIGVIGSQTKSARFRHKLANKGFTQAQIDQMHCPMGEHNLRSKQPGEIAISVLSQLLKIRASQHTKASAAMPVK
ncbi:xanthine dehydrogenase accessory protein XdhC [Marinomonas spartinae]|uniref:xanthine dehydrogenase accessory protein XdhC n=1 Tax=Marinomonas spartinae TaxID=1792290 RepID=UPI0018F19B7A|nr:xanthine dehydrogenase accessory protein XdhC [Marinomonas spartinae]MBJ7555934.1 xanthine dehydrogenase accessory protein XdhC [Marinomonas spartinae]